MAAHKVFKEMVAYHRQTGKVMGKRLFKELIAKKFKEKDVATGVWLFSRYLDAKRKGGTPIGK